MNIYAKAGDRVIFIGRGGRDHEVLDAIKAGLVVGALYTVDWIDVHNNWSSNLFLFLAEFPGHGFNTVMFEDEGGGQDEGGDQDDREKPKVQEPGLYYIRSYKHDQNNAKGDERALWWRPRSCGYTYDLREAGKYTEDEAREICGPGNATMVGHGPVAKLERNNLMYPVEQIDGLTALMVSRFDLPKHVEVPE